MARMIKHEADGPIKIEERDFPIWICACGLSKNQPFCDGSHKHARSEEAGKVYEYDEDRNRKEI